MEVIATNMQVGLGPYHQPCRLRHIRAELQREDTRADTPINTKLLHDALHFCTGWRNLIEATKA